MDEEAVRQSMELSQRLSEDAIGIICTIILANSDSDVFLPFYRKIN